MLREPCSALQSQQNSDSSSESPTPNQQTQDEAQSSPGSIAVQAQIQNASHSSPRNDPSQLRAQTQLSLEKARVRDLLKYYTPGKSNLPAQRSTSILQPGCDDASDTATSNQHSNDVVAQVEESIPDDSVLLAHDPTLVAFAQLGAFRLNCQRSFISLINGANQFILAEGTRSVSLDDPEQYDKNDAGGKVYLGARVLDMKWGVCPNTIQVFTALDDSLNISTDLINANKEFYVMNDLSAIPAFANRPYVTAWPHMRFYAEVPIHSPTGHVIGTFCVVDDKPRNGLDQKGLHALNEISSAIMKHLALVRTQQGLQHAGKMVKGLSMFVEGKSNLEDLRNGQPQEGSSISSQMNSPPTFRPPGTVHTLSSSAINQTSELNQKDTSTPTSISPVSAHQYTSHGSKPRLVNSTADPRRSTSEFASRASQKGDESSEIGNLLPRERKLSMDYISNMRESIASAGTKALFPRACALIREAIDLDGMMFIDACFRDVMREQHQQASSTRRESYSFRGIPQIPDAGTDSVEWLGNHIQTGIDSIPFVADPFPARTETEDIQQIPLGSDILGYSLRGKVRLGCVSSSLQQVKIPQSTLRSLTRRYRKGHIFFFDEDGTLAQNAEALRQRYLHHNPLENQNMSVESERAIEQNLATQILNICVGARAIIFFPLWDHQRDQWFAGGLAWTNDPTRVLQPEDITYLSAFGSCIMVEKARLDALTADRAKADFISSVSHELRSPLHGVLASAEALQETSTGFVQDDLIRTITVCGGVLLDTMDQILEYAKISNSRDRRSTQDGGSVSRKHETQSSKTTNLDLSNLVETVVEGLFAGYGYRRKTLEQQITLPEASHKDSSTFAASSSRDILIILSIDWQVSWIFESQIGGWKRILMNLFGNALKYTEAGFVHIILRAIQNQKLSKAPGQTNVVLQIDDSGRGMSKDYMKYELFTPFAQEDNMSMGTGLGLSIVRQLVAELGGTIDLESEKGYGTSVKVVAPLTATETLEPHLLEGLSRNSDVRTRCKGLTFCLVGFEYYPDIGDTPTGILSVQAKRMLMLKASIASYAAEWFGMTITAAASLHSASGDILIGLQSKLNFSGGKWKGRPLIVFEDIAPTHHHDDKALFPLSQPVGPYKMARILIQCLEYISSIWQFKNAAGEIPTSIPDTPPPLSINPLSLVEGVNQKAVQAFESLKTTQPVNQEPPFIPSRLAPGSLSSLNSEVSKLSQQVREVSIIPREMPQRSNVLLVEDNIINMKILINYMKSAKQQFVTAVNGLEALQHYEADPLSFKIIFMDISMPVMDGLTSTRKMRLFEMENSLPRTRIVALTCFSSAEYQKEALFSGIDLFLIKPVPMKTLQPILELNPHNVIDPG